MKETGFSKHKLSKIVCQLTGHVDAFGVLPICVEMATLLAQVRHSVDLRYEA